MPHPASRPGGIPVACTADNRLLLSARSTTSKGAVISGATVKATNTETAFSRTVIANGYGQYRIDYLPVGTYTLEVNANGFRRYVQKNIALTVDQTQTVPVSLSVGTETQTITVTRGATHSGHEHGGAGQDDRAR